MGSKGGGGGGDQARAAIEAANIAAGAQREQLDYLKEVEAIPQQYRQAAIQQLGAISGIGEAGAAQPEARQQFISGLTEDPLYQALVGPGSGAEEAVLRNRAVTGNLRGGGTIRDLAGLQNQALLQTYQDRLGGLQSLAGLPSNASQIASLGSQIGQTQAAGITGAAAARAQGQQQQTSNLLNLAATGGLLYAISDPRLKENIKLTSVVNGVKFYSWKWNSLAKKVFGLEGDDNGVLTNEHPDCCETHESGYKMVNYAKVFDKVNANA